MKFIKGDIVRFLNETGEGTVTRLVNKQLIMVDLGDGLELRADARELILIKRSELEDEVLEEDETEDEIMEDEIFLEEQEDFESDEARIELPDLSVLKSRDFSERSKKDQLINPQDFASSLSTKVVDLHLEKLTSEINQLNNSEKLYFQLLHFEKIMDEAMAGKYKRIVFIHGVGNGVLRKEILRRLKTYSDIKFFDANEHHFGYGATEVQIL